MSPMFTEIEETLISLLREKLVEIPKEHITTDTWPNKPPAVKISNLEFKLQNAAMAANMDTGRVEREEIFDGDGVKTSFALQEKPLKNSVRIESPLGILLEEKGDYAVKYANRSIDFIRAPEKGKNRIRIRYFSQKCVMTVKSLKLKALYCFEVWGDTSTEADSIAEKVINALVMAEDQLLEREIEIKPVGGTFIVEKDQTKKIRMRYVIEKELRIEQIVGPIEKIEIASKNL